MADLVGVETENDKCCTNVLYQNLCGVTNKKDEIELYLHGLLVKPSLLCVCEHFLNNVSASMFNVCEYNLVSINTRVNKKRGGSLILARNDKNVEDLNICRQLYKINSFEICGVKDLDTNINIICIYRTPDNKLFDSFICNLELLLEQFFNKKCAIFGDFNIDFLTDSKQKSELLSILSCYNYRHLVNTPTFMRNHSKSCIDNVLTNLTSEELGTMDVDFNGLGDGHASLSCTLLTKGIETKKRIKEEIYIAEKRCFSHKNRTVFRDQLIKQDWTSMGINTFLSRLVEVFRYSFKKVKKRITLEKNYKINWVTKGIKTSSKMKRFLNNCVVQNTDVTIKQYKINYIKLYRRVIRCMKRLSVAKELSKAENNIKAIWNIVNRHRNKRSSKGMNKIILKCDDKIIDDPQDIACVFSDYFYLGIDQTATDQNDAISILKENCHYVDNSMEFRKVTPNEILNLVVKMENKKSCGWDELKIDLIKDNIDILASPLAEFFNNCVEQSIFPDQLKLAKVLPIFKKGSKLDPSKYRPISLLPILSKIFEKVILHRLNTHLAVNRLISGRQFGYRKGVGTSDAVDTLVDDAVRHLTEKKKVAALFLDLSSAFDTVDHNILLGKLEHYGVRNNLMKLMESYLKNRKQFVEIKCNENGIEQIARSNVKDVARGVPQGSILGPVLFTIFTNDLVSYMNNNFPMVRLVLFADDTNAIISADNIEELNNSVQTTIIAFHSWFVSNHLRLNTDKTNIMLFKATTRNNDTLLISLNGAIIESVDQVKFLGIHLDSSLNWKAELTAIENSISSACYALRSLRDEVSKKHLLSVYYALIESRLRYSIKLWGNSYKYNINKAFVCQKRAIRTIMRIPPWQSCKEHFKTLGILPLPCLYILVLLSDLAKKLSRLETQEDKQKRLLTRRRDVRIGHVQPTLNVAQHTARYQSVKLYNSLPQNLKIIDSSDLFKCNLKQYLLEECFYSIEEFLGH